MAYNLINGLFQLIKSTEQYLSKISIYLEFYL